MKRRHFLAGATALLLAGCLPADPSQRVVIIGDSTASFYRRSRRPLMGWGQVLGEWLKGRATVWNQAVPGTSTRSFAVRYWRRVRGRLKPGDVVLIQFGHNDAAPEPTRHAEPWGEYAAQLTRFVDGARQAGAVPVLVTPIPRCLFEGNRVADTHGAYLDAMHETARTLGVPLIDLHAAATAAMESLGETRACEWYMATFDGHDRVHLSPAGAREMARLVADALLELGLVGADEQRRAALTRLGRSRQIAT